MRSLSPSLPYLFASSLSCYLHHLHRDIVTTNHRYFNQLDNIGVKKVYHRQPESPICTLKLCIPVQKSLKDTQAEDTWQNNMTSDKAAKEIKQVHKEFKPLQSQIAKFKGSSSDSQYKSLDGKLTSLLTKLDGIDSHGSEKIRSARKKLVIQIQTTANQLEKKGQSASTKPESSKPEPSPKATETKKAGKKKKAKGRPKKTTKSKKSKTKSTAKKDRSPSPAKATSAVRSSWSIWRSQSGSKKEQAVNHALNSPSKQAAKKPSSRCTIM